MRNRVHSSWFRVQCLHCAFNLCSASAALPEVKELLRSTYLFDGIYRIVRIDYALNLLSRTNPVNPKEGEGVYYGSRPSDLKMRIDRQLQNHFSAMVPLPDFTFDKLDVIQS